MVVRLKCHEGFAEEIQVCKGHFDSTLCQALQNVGLRVLAFCSLGFAPLAKQALLKAKGNGISPKTFLAVHEAIVGLVLPMPSVEKIMQEKESFLNVERELQQVVSSSSLGLRLFGAQVRDTLAAMADRKIKEAIAQLTSATITPSTVFECKKLALQSIQGLQNVAELPARRL
eukprot:9935416-Alexandrium_andersonii.AAC.1